MIDHTGVLVSDYQVSKAWYSAALAPIGYGLILEVPAAVTGTSDATGFGEIATGKPDFWILGKTAEMVISKPGQHIAFRVASRTMVDAFHAAAMAAGAADNGAPGVRPHYHLNYYGAFVLDPDGHNIEAVCHEAA